MVVGNMTEVYGGVHWESFVVDKTLFRGVCLASTTYNYIRDTGSKNYVWTHGGYGSACYFPDASTVTHLTECDYPTYHQHPTSSVVHGKTKDLSEMNNKYPI